MDRFKDKRCGKATDLRRSKLGESLNLRYKYCDILRQAWNPVTAEYNQAMYVEAMEIRDQAETMARQYRNR